MNLFPLPLIESVPGVSCVFTGRSDVPRPEPVSLLPLLGPGVRTPARLAILRQIHSNKCVIVRESDFSTGQRLFVAGDGDALVTAERGLALGVATADCLPLVAVDQGAGVIAVIHAGWRGTLAGVLEATLQIMRDGFGVDTSLVMIGAGPAAGACCYEVGPEVREAFAASRPAHCPAIFTPTRDGRARLDLIEANRLQARGIGVPVERFVSAGVCTICRPGLTHSFRRDGVSAGRMWLLGALAP